jgi:hypothetical protein
MLPPPPIFLGFPEYTTSEDEGEKDTGSPLAERNMSADQSEEEEDKKAMGTSLLAEQGGRPLLEDLSEGLLISLLALALPLTLGLTVLFLKLRRTLASVMRSDSLQVLL